MNKRIAGLLLVFLLSLLPTPAFAAETGGSLPERTVTVVNPLYAGTADGAASAEHSDSAAAQTQAAGRTAQNGASAGAFASIGDAAAFVRSQMANRQQTVTLSYRTAAKSDEQVSIVKDIVSHALEETDQCNEGDFLRWQYGKYVCNVQGSWTANSDGTRTYSYKFIYTFSYYTTAEQERELNAAVRAALQSLGLGQATDYQKIQRIYQYVCTHVTYDYSSETPDKYTAYDAMERGTAVCQGYALLLYRMLREAGLSTRIIAGTATATGENHAWNIVRLGSSYYNLDSTWDAQTQGGFAYFLRGTDSFPGHAAWKAYTADAFRSRYPAAKTAYAPTEADTSGTAPAAGAPQVPQGLCALCGQTLRDVLPDSRFVWQQPEQPVGTEAGQRTFLMSWIPADADASAVTDLPVTVTVYDTIGLHPERMTTYVGAELRLIPSAMPNNAPADVLTWSSDRPEVASVGSDGIVTANRTGQAVLTVRSGNGETASCTLTVDVLPFADVPANAWYFDAVAYAFGNGLFAGTGPTAFLPKNNMTRAMLVQVLYNISGKPEVQADAPFSDVPKNKWYADAVAWGAANGIVSGTGGGVFAPNADVTREQTAQILRNYADFRGYSTAAEGDISGFSDRTAVSSWAVSAVKWAVGSNLIAGVGGSRLAPRNTATRAQVAQIMMSFDYNVVYG